MAGLAALLCSAGVLAGAAPPEQRFATAEFLPYIPLGQLYTPVAHRANIRGLIEMPIPVMWNVSIG